MMYVIKYEHLYALIYVAYIYDSLNKTNIGVTSGICS